LTSTAPGQRSSNSRPRSDRATSCNDLCGLDPFSWTRSERTAPCASFSMKARPSGGTAVLSRRLACNRI
jgi:hypothetical protein